MNESYKLTPLLYRLFANIISRGESETSASLFIYTYIYIYISLSSPRLAVNFVMFDFLNRENT